MHNSRLRKVGGSVMLAVPPTILDLLGLRAGSDVGMAIESGRLVVEARKPPHYTLDELLAQCDATGEPTTEEKAWLDAPATGAELL